MHINKYLASIYTIITTQQTVNYGITDEMVRKQQRKIEPIVYLINFQADTLKFHRIF